MAGRQQQPWTLYPVDCVVHGLAALADTSYRRASRLLVGGIHCGSRAVCVRGRSVCGHVRGRPSLALDGDHRIAELCDRLVRHSSADISLILFTRSRTMADVPSRRSVEPPTVMVLSLGSGISSCSRCDGLSGRERDRSWTDTTSSCRGL